MDVKTLRKYIGSSNWWLVIMGCVFLLVGIGNILPLLEEFSWKSLLIVLFVTAMGGVAIWAGVSSSRSFKTYMQQLEDSGEIGRVVRDFESAKPLVKDQVRMGQYYIFGKKMDRAVRYEDIRQVYQHITKRNFIESSRCLKYVDGAGKVRELCSLELRGKSDEDVKQIVMMILTKNPNVKLGYK